MDAAAACVAATDAGLVHPTAFMHAEGAFVSGLTPDLRTRYDGRGATYDDAVVQLAINMNRDVVQPSKAMLADVGAEELF